jgi:hypothetical protein
MKFLKKGKLMLYTNNDANEFAIKIGGEEEFKAVSNNNANCTKVIAELKIGSEGLADLSWDQILSRWISWYNNINEKDYKFLKSFGILHFIDENEKVQITTEKTQYRGHSHVPLYDKVILTDKRIIIFKPHTSIFHVNWEPYSVPLSEIHSIKTEGHLPIYSIDIIVNNTEKINHIKKSIAKEIVDYVNKYIEDRNSREA